MKTQKDDFAQSTEQENRDINANCKKCSCELLETELKNIEIFSRQALATLRSNYQCTKCNGITQRTSQKSK